MIVDHNTPAFTELPVRSLHVQKAGLDLERQLLQADHDQFLDTFALMIRARRTHGLRRVIVDDTMIMHAFAVSSPNESSALLPQKRQRRDEWLAIMRDADDHGRYCPVLLPRPGICDDRSMSFLEVRRHSHRKSGAGSQLSQAGVDLARDVGAACGPYAEVVTSVLPRARETAVAMGFAVDRELVTQLTDEDVLGAIDRSQAAYLAEEGAVATPGMFASWSRLLTRGDPVTATTDQEVLFRWSQTIAALWRDLMTPHGNGDARVLFVGHSGDLEAGVVSCLPGADHASWGEAFGPLDGAVLEFAGELARFRHAEIIRV